MHYGSFSDNNHSLFSSPSNGDSNSKRKIRDLEARVEKLELVCEALWEIVRNARGLEEIDLIEQMIEVDMRDDVLDGKKKKISAIECDKCGRVNSKKHAKCMYCGNPLLTSPFE